MYTARATCDTMLLPDIHFFSAFDVSCAKQTADTFLDASHSQEPEARVACEERTKTGMVMMLGGITKKVCVNYEQIIPEVARSTGYDNDDKGLDWRAMNVIVATEEKTLDVTQTLMLAEPRDNAGARDTFGRYTTDETPEAMPLTQRLALCLYTQLDTARRDGDLGWALTSDFVRVSEEPSLEKDEAENGYQKDTQENNVTKASSSANGALHVLEFMTSEGAPRTFVFSLIRGAVGVFKGTGLFQSNQT